MLRPKGVLVSPLVQADTARRPVGPILLPVLAGLTLLLQASCSRTQTASVRGDAANPIAVRVYPVREETLRRWVQAVGSLYALEESTVSAEVEGRVEKVLVDVGDAVRGGQVLVTLSALELQYELERQRGTVRQVRARLGLGPNDPLPRDPAQVAFVQRAAADLFDAEQKFHRAEQLFRDHLISQQQLDEASARYKGARAAHDLAIQEVEQDKAQLQSSEALSKLAEKKLADATIRAPFPGAVKERRVSPGEYLKVQSPVMVIVRTDTLRARLAVPEKWAGAVKTGATIDVRVEAYPNDVFHGRLERINPAVLHESRTFEVEALLPNSLGRLKPGFFIQASLPSEVEEKTLTVPEEAVSYRYGVYKVFVLNGSRVAERPIKPGMQQGSTVEVLEGLRVGERVAVAVEGELRDGATVREDPARPGTR
ncbi:MAG: efflux RND transporter periplasmic adaptor subunit [Acidobacteria bacterium]|nr:efflux RND transporter periplasmic adaptor subunit [Acidobacteriota bacterium]